MLCLFLETLLLTYVLCSTIIIACRDANHQVQDFTLICLTCINVYLQEGRSSLMVASQYGHEEVVEKLIQRGATVDLQDEVINPFLSLIILWLGGSHFCEFEAWFLVYSQVTLHFYVLG